MRSLRNGSWRSFLLAAVTLAALDGSADAQISGAQQNALKQSCRSDFMSHCAGVTPGGQEALACLQKNVAGLSPACKQAVSATLPAPTAPATAKTTPAAPPAAPKAKTATAPAVVAPATAAVPAVGPTPQQLSAIKHTCGRDFSLHCRGVPPGGAEALACLQRNEPRLTPDCKTSFADIADTVPAAAVPGAPPIAAAPPVAAPTAKPVAPVASGVVVGRACLRDLVLHCRGTGVGEGEKIACLKARAASGHRLSVLCEAALKITPMR